MVFYFHLNSVYVYIDNVGPRVAGHTIADLMEWSPNIQLLSG